MKFIVYLTIAFLFLWFINDYQEQQQEKYKVTIQIMEEK